MITNALKFKAKKENRGRKRVMSSRSVALLVRQSENKPLMTATELKTELKIEASVETIRRRLRECNLYGRSPRKVPLKKKCHITHRLRFAQQRLEWPIEKWRNILWSDESKIVLFGGRGTRQYVRREPNTEYDPRNTLNTVKHGGSSIMIWGCFSYYGVGPIYRLNGIMDSKKYVEILDTIMLPYAREDMPIKWVYQQDNDPKHTSKLAKQWFRANRVEVMDWPAQSPDLTPIENLWRDIKKAVWDAKPTNNNNLWGVVERAWYAIPLEKCQNLVDSMHRRCGAVIANKGFSTKY